MLFTSPVPHDNYANDSEFSVLIKCPKYLYVSPLKGGIAPKGQQNIAQGTALGSRTLPPTINCSALKGQQNIRRATP